MHAQQAPRHLPAGQAFIICALAVAALVACKEEPAKRLPAPKTVPAFLAEFVPWSTSSRARSKAVDGATALSKDDLGSARSLLTEAVSLDPSWIRARIDLARVYVRGGHPEVAIKLLTPLTSAGDTCGGCVDAFEQLAALADLQPLLQSAAGKKLLAAAPAQKLEWTRWASEFSAALAHVDPDVIDSYIHPQEPFVLIRSCPECSNPDRRKPERRELRGAAIAVKLATRFDTRRPRLGAVPLRQSGKPTCAKRCCTWKVPTSITVGEATITRLCFRPTDIKSGALTEVQIAYGQSVNDRERVEAAEKRRREIEGIPLPRRAVTPVTAP